MIVLGCRVQRPTRWWDLVGWWEEISHPFWRVAHRRGVHLCRCLLVGHDWRGDSTEYVVCVRKCCRGCQTHGVRWAVDSDER